MRKIVLAALLFLLVTALPLYARAAIVELHDGQSAVNVARSIDMVVDPQRSLHIDDVARTQVFTPFGRLPDTRAAYWLRLTYTTGTSRDPWYLFLGFKAETADFYAPQSGGGYALTRSGVSLPFAQRPVKLLGSVAFELPPAPQPRTVYIRVTAIEPDITTYIDSSQLLWWINSFNINLIVGLDSVLFAMLLSSIALVLMARNSVYALYAGYLVAELLSRSNEIGLAGAVLWPNWAVSIIHLDVVFDGIRIVMASLVVGAALGLRQVAPLWYRVNLAVAAVAAAYVIAALLGAPLRASWSWQFALVYVPVWIVCAAVAWRKGEERAPFFVLAWSALMLFSVSFALKQALGLGRGNVLTELIVSHGSYFGVALQSVFLSLAFSIDLRRVTRARDRYEALAAVDGLTGIANRRAFDEAFVAEWNRAARNRSPLSLLMIDVDLFKAYNDTYGHAAGDDCLRMVAHAGESVMRKSGERFCRYGGEEFAAILPDADEIAAQRVAERVRSAVYARETLHEGSPHGAISVSVGVATARPADGGTSHELLSAADNALYLAKEKGRNCIVTAEQAGDIVVTG